MLKLRRGLRVAAVEPRGSGTLIQGKAFWSGVLGTLGLVSFYFLVMLVSSRSWLVTIGQFKQLWPWITLLSLGFGFQLGLYVRLRSVITHNPSHDQVLIASGSTSSLSMVACCAHHLTDVLPFLGLSGLSLLLVNYQKPILFLSLLVNLAGTAFMIRQLRGVSSMIQSQKGGD